MDECAICLGNLTSDIEILPCKHKFHSRCIKKIHSNKCPLCRVSFKNVEINKEEKEEVDEEILDLSSNVTISFPLIQLLLFSYPDKILESS